MQYDPHPFTLWKLTRLQAYLSCYGFCDVDEATEPFCGMPVERDVEEASPSQVEIAHAEITAAAEFNDSPEMHEKRDAEPKGSTLRNFISMFLEQCFSIRYTS